MGRSPADGQLTGQPTFEAHRLSHIQRSNRQAFSSAAQNMEAQMLDLVRPPLRRGCRRGLLSASLRRPQSMAPSRAPSSRSAQPSTGDVLFGMTRKSVPARGRCQDHRSPRPFIEPRSCLGRTLNRQLPWDRLSYYSLSGCRRTIALPGRALAKQTERAELTKKLHTATLSALTKPAYHADSVAVL